jgi:4-hydroxybenzoate polyprenyltransferase
MKIADIIRAGIRFLIYTNIFLAACVTSLVVETYLLLFGRIVDWQYPFFLFCSTLTLYCFHRIYRFNFRAGAEKMAGRHRWTQEHRALFFAVFAMAASGVAVSLCFFVNFRTVLYLLPIGLISFGYTVPCLPTRKGWIRLRDVPFIKILLIALVLGLTTVLLPILGYERLSDLNRPEFIFVFLRRMLFIFAITVPFDIRDMDYDRASGTRTLPVVLGVKRARQWAVAALLLMIALEAVQYVLYPATNVYYLLALALSAVPAGVLLLKTEAGRSEFFYSVGLEGMMLVQCLLVMGASKPW